MMAKRESTAMVTAGNAKVAFSISKPKELAGSMPTSLNACVAKENSSHLEIKCRQNQSNAVE